MDPSLPVSYRAKWEGLGPWVSSSCRPGPPDPPLPVSPPPSAATPFCEGGGSPHRVVKQGSGKARTLPSRDDVLRGGQGACLALVAARAQADSRLVSPLGCCGTLGVCAGHWPHLMLQLCVSSHMCPYLLEPLYRKLLQWQCRSLWLSTPLLCL